MTGKVLILGPTGRFGRNCAEAFWNAAWQVRCFDRAGEMSLSEAASDVDVIVHAWNPAYEDWKAQVPGLTQQVIQAAKINAATVILPGNLYVFGADAPEVLGPDTPHAATNLLGRVRINMEESFRASGVRTVVIRAGDFIDTEASGNWFDVLMVAGLNRGVFCYPGDTDANHVWAYLPDLARAVVELAEQREGLNSFEDIAFPGYQLSGLDVFKAVQNARKQKLKLKKMNWLPLYLFAPFRKNWQHLIEMRYLWNKAHSIDETRFYQRLPDFQETPLNTAIESAIAHLEPCSEPPALVDPQAV